MLIENPQRTAALLAIGITGMLFAGGRTPAHAACSPAAADKPDLAFEDSNCDGIDGDKASAIFVAPGGDDSHSGSFGSPKKTVAAAASAALSAGKDVYVAAGTYDGKVALLGAGGHIGIYGGYDPTTWQRSAASVATLRAPGQVVSVAVPGVVLQLLNVQGVSDPSVLNSYGVRAFNAGTVALSRVTVNAAAGRNGTDGGVPPAPPAATPNGQPGEKDCKLLGGAGGGVGVPGVLAGGTGGAAWNDAQQWKGYSGASEPSDPSVEGGIGGQYQGQSGGQGASGHTGTDGQGGSAALNYAAIFYQAMQGSPGTKGTRGAGGGGGAAGEACLTGPGGGAGGLPGEGGMGGWGGGGSIGVFAGAGAHVLITDGTTIQTAAGGKGGNGGIYQEGGPGGKGGPALDMWAGGQYFKSGKGGDGGYGGHGGRGGGGAGGASVGVLAIDASTVVDEDTTTINVGPGGQGGIGGFNGKTGASSLATQVTTAGGSIPAVGDFDGDGVDDASDACPIVAAPGGCPAPAGGGGTPGGSTPAGGTPDGGTPGTPSGGATGGIPAAGSTPATVALLPTSSCLARRAFTIRINARRAHLKSARLTLDGRRLRLVKGARIWKARVDLRRSARTRHTLTIRGTLRGGKRVKQTRRYRTCA